MKRLKLFGLIIFMGVSTTFLAQTVVDFEDLSLDPESHWDGSDLSGSFTSGYATFFNYYDETYFMWEGFAYTNETDNTTYSFDNQYTSAAGIGAEGSANYAVSWVNTDWMNDYSPIPTVVKFDTETMPEIIPGMYVSLNAYSSLYIADGDFYENGNHWLKLRINAISTTTWFATSREFIIADYRFENAEDNFKFDSWNYIDMSWAEGADSLNFILLSSDSGDYGVNTPAYFCLDNIGANLPIGVPQLETEIASSYTIAYGESVYISALANGGVQPYTFQWSEEPGLDDYESQTPNANPTETTTYNVTVTDALGNESTGSVTVNVNPVNVVDIVFAELQVYFNSNNNLYIENNSIISKINIFDVTGKAIKSISPCGFNASIDMNDIPTGIYIVNIESEESIISRKIVK